MSKINYLLTLALLASGAANAATENPWYAGARLGGTHYSDFSESILQSNHRDKDDVGAGLFVGYNFKPWLALETGYTYLGEAEFENIGSIEQQGIDLVGKFTWNVNDSVGIFAKAGGFYYFADGQDQLSNYDDDGIVATAGVGMEYFFNKNVSARLEYQYYNNVEMKDLDINSNWDTHFYGISIVYAWGAPVIIAAAPIAMTEPEPVVEAEPVVEPVIAAIAVKPLTIELPFEFNSGKLSQQYIDQLAPIAKHLLKYPEAKLFIVGHTDSRGSEAYNQKLSEQRAALVGDYLATEFDIDKSRIKETGRGELSPRATNETAEGRALNRRVSVFTPGLTIQNK